MIAGGFEDFGNRHHVFPQQGLPLVLARIQPRNQRGAGGGTFGAIVKLGKPQALGRQPVEMRRANFTAVTTDVRPSHVIAHDEHNVRASAAQGGFRCRGRRKHQPSAQHQPESYSDQGFHHRHQLAKDSQCHGIERINSARQWVSKTELPPLGHWLPMGISQRKGLIIWRQFPDGVAAQAQQTETA